MKNGFTLIELLAVIVILAIIALIATPIVLNIINESKESAVLRSAEFYIGALEKQVMLENMNTGGSFNPTVCQITNKGVSCDGSKVELKIDGELPIRGRITFESGKIKNVDLSYQNGYVSLNSEGKLELGESNIPEAKSFAEDSWDTIAANVRAGNLSKYKVGDTKEITLTSEDYNVAGTYTVRIANTSTPSECKTKGFSQTACGFVVEFAETISDYVMTKEDSNAGGWEESLMRGYVNNEILNSFPEDLKLNILETDAISGHEKNKEENYETIDKLYILSVKEVYGDGDFSDSALDQTRQLDYYKNIGVTSAEDCDVKPKKNNNLWWLRSTGDESVIGFYIVRRDGSWSYYHSIGNYGVSVAFRL